MVYSSYLFFSSGDQRVETMVWSKAMKRLLRLVSRSVEFKEPVLLVGGTGSGKTTICQVLAAISKAHLHILNCHEHSETADFLGGQRPMRGKELTTSELQEALLSFLRYLIQNASDLGISLESLHLPSDLESLELEEKIALFDRLINSVKGLPNPQEHYGFDPFLLLSCFSLWF